jgi:hypothetical protein
VPERNVCGRVQCQECMLGLYCRRTPGHTGHCNEQGDGAAALVSAVDRLVAKVLQ